MATQRSNKGNGAPLTDKLLTAIANHLNQEHRDDLLAFAQAANLDWAEQAQVLTLDTAGVNLEVVGKGEVQHLRIDFPEPANGVLAFKRSFGVLIAKSRAQLGLPTLEDSHEP
ncbi:protein of unknown function (DUF2470) [Rubidibacter lacunae KORDI 51-2]|uniref:DUF2470 domain-containing protein n=1 Tax=Rubidibacter lacunae KORDI 51-2 TaxID=582515 RepID=U5DTL9_9CHRO|nr:DUF2470 domain-containing protein [Rubidibacter lacunae]ERN43020.1 protein of unknown function (DUF2470) [Rubidibacter lacunae KORDI 51-2]